MAGTKRASESVDLKSSKKFKPVKDLPNKAKFASNPAADSEDFAAFDEEPQQAATVKRHDSTSRGRQTDTVKPETFLNGKLDHSSLVSFYSVIDHAMLTVRSYRQFVTGSPC